MGPNATSFLAYGIACSHEQEFPWVSYPDEGGEYEDFEGWWREIGQGADTGQTLFDNRLAPEPPIEVVDIGSDKYPMYFLAVPGTVHMAEPGRPEEISTSPRPHPSWTGMVCMEASAISCRKIDPFISFIKKHVPNLMMINGVEQIWPAKWHLCCYQH